MTEPAPKQRWSALRALAVVLVATAGAFLLRTWPPADLVFTTQGVNFNDVDTWYHVRRVEHLVHHFPHDLQHDPYALAPRGQTVAVAPLLDWMAAGAALALSGGDTPPLDLTHGVCAWLPPILGVLVVPCVHAITRGLFGRMAAALAAMIIATLPGPFLSRSLLGYTDHHVAEVLCSTLTMLALLSALRGPAPARRATTMAPCESPPLSRTTLLRSLAAGLALACYLLSWVVGSLLVFIIFVGAAFQLFCDHLRARTSALRLLVATLPCLLTALAIIAPFQSLPGYDLHVTSLSAGAAALSALAGLSIALRRARVRPVWILPAVATLLAAECGLAFLVAPAVCDHAGSMLRAFFDGRSASTISEAAPLPAGSAAELLASLWAFFTSNGLLAIAALVVVSFTALRRGRADHTLLAVWSALMLLAMLQQRRFGYYAAVNVAILSSAAVVTSLRWIKDVLPGARPRDAATAATGALLAIAVAVAPNLPLALRTARDHTGPSADWHAALDWLRTTTQEPFGDAAYYVAPYDAPPPRPLNSSVMCWWDDGYWMIQIARRVPAANPTQAGADVAARFFTSTDEADAADIMRRIRATHVVIDRTLPLWASEGGREGVGKFHHVPFWAGKKLSTFVEEMRLRTANGRLEPVTAYHPSYYQSMCVRLYTFSADAFRPANASWLIRVEAASDADPRRIIRERRRFETHAAAVEFATAHADESWQLVGFTPYRSCVPLEKLQHFGRVFQSPTVAATRGERTISEVEIFELLPAAP